MDFFRDDSGQLSIIRLMSFLVLIVGVIITFTIVTAVLTTPGITQDVLKFCFGVIIILMVCAFAPKTIQKFAEYFIDKVKK